MLFMADVHLKFMGFPNPCGAAELLLLNPIARKGIFSTVSIVLVMGDATNRPILKNRPTHMLNILRNISKA